MRIFSRVCARAGTNIRPRAKHIKKAVSKIGTKCDTNGYFPDVKGKKRKMAELITSPDFDDNISRACEKIGVARSTFYRWYGEGDFRDYVNFLIERYTESETANVWKATIETAKKGNPQAQKLFFELRGLYKQSVDLKGGGAVVIIGGEKDLE